MANGESAPLRGQFDLSMEQLRGALLVMGQQVERSIRGSVNALGQHDVAAAEVVLRQESEVNRMHRDIDDSCLRLLATEQPVATDLRQIVGTLNVIGQLERIGDLAVHVASVAQRLAPEQFSRGLSAIMQMADEACAMIRDSLQAFVTQDEAAAEQVSARDRKVDEIYANIFRDSAVVHDGEYQERRAGVVAAVRGQATGTVRRPFHQYLRGGDFRHHRQTRRSESRLTTRSRGLLETEFYSKPSSTRS